jgi:type IV secretory pathway VirJ component
MAALILVLVSLLCGPSFKDALAAQAGDTLDDLPLTEVLADSSSTGTMAVTLTGDGGYGVTDKGIARTLAEHGVPVVVLNSLHYFQKRRAPEEASADLERILRHYLQSWKMKRVVLVGYSLGADVLPFMLNRLPPDLRSRVPVLALLAPSAEADFQFHLTDWFGTHHRKTALPVPPELERLRGLRILCFYGYKDKEAICDQLDAGLVTSFPIEGGHRFANRYGPIAEQILKAAR